MAKVKKFNTFHPKFGEGLAKGMIAALHRAEAKRLAKLAASTKRFNLPASLFPPIEKGSK